MVSQIIQRNGALESPAQLAYRHEAKAQLADQAGQPTSPCASGALPLCQGRVCPESTGMIQPMAVLGFFFGMLATLAEGLLVYHGLPALARAFPVGDGIASVVAIFFLTFLVGLVVSRWPHFGPGRSLQAASWGTLVGFAAPTVLVCSVILSDPDVAMKVQLSMTAVGLLMGLFGAWCGCKPNLLRPGVDSPSPSP